MTATWVHGKLSCDSEDSLESIPFDPCLDLNRWCECRRNSRPEKRVSFVVFPLNSWFLAASCAHPMYKIMNICSRVVEFSHMLPCCWYCGRHWGPNMITEDFEDGDLTILCVPPDVATKTANPTIQQQSVRFPTFQQQSKQDYLQQSVRFCQAALGGWGWLCSRARGNGSA